MEKRNYDHHFGDYLVKPKCLSIRFLAVPSFCHCPCHDRRCHQDALGLLHLDHRQPDIGSPDHLLVVLMLVEFPTRLFPSTRHAYHEPFLVVRPDRLHTAHSRNHLEASALKPRGTCPPKGRAFPGQHD